MVHSLYPWRYQYIAETNGYLLVKWYSAQKLEAHFMFLPTRHIWDKLWIVIIYMFLESSSSAEYKYVEIFLKLINYSWAWLPIRLLGLGDVYRARVFISNRAPDEGTMGSDEDHFRKWGKTAFRQRVQVFLNTFCSGVWLEQSGK